MRLLRIIGVIAVAVSVLATMEPAQAQRQAPEQRSQIKRVPKLALDRGARLDGLFEALKLAPSGEIARVIEKRIEATLLQSGSPTADLLMTRARTTVEAKDYDLSISLLDAIVEIEPEFTEAYAQRATVHYLKKDLGRSLADLRVVLAREPRHYSSIAGLGVILQDLGQHKRALEAFRRAIAINPNLKQVPELIKRLEVRVEGREI